MPLDENAPSANPRPAICSGARDSAPPSQLENFVGLSRGAAADELLGFKPNGFKPSGKSIDDVRNKWIAYMVKVKAPLQEKLVLFWHDHFATSATRSSSTRSSWRCRTARSGSTARATSRAS